MSTADQPLAATAPLSKQSTQYNNISTAYSTIYPSSGTPSTLPCGAFEEVQFRHALTSSSSSSFSSASASASTSTPESSSSPLTGARVLDLACGNGFYSTRYLDWGASRVVGVDISSGMVALAAASTARARGVHGADALRFVVGDATDASLKVDSGVDQGGLFDVVACAWLLNYAGSAATLTKMWDAVARHLRPGGRFVGLTISPLVTPGKGGGVEAVRGEAEVLRCAMRPDGAWGKLGVRGRVLEVMEEGLRMEIELGYRERGEDVAVFENYYLGLTAFEKSIADCVVDGKPAFEGLEWQDTVITEELKKGKPVGYWNESTVYPLCRVCTAKRFA